jgi:hypothetical protein
MWQPHGTCPPPLKEGPALQPTCKFFAQLGNKTEDECSSTCSGISEERLHINRALVQTYGVHTGLFHTAGGASSGARRPYLTAEPAVNGTDVNHPECRSLQVCVCLPFRYYCTEYVYMYEYYPLYYLLA